MQSFNTTSRLSPTPALQSSCVSSVELTDRRGGRGVGEEHYHTTKNAWSSINHSILTVHTCTVYCIFLFGPGCFLISVTNHSSVSGGFRSLSIICMFCNLKDHPTYSLRFKASAKFKKNVISYYQYVTHKCVYVM